jgi:hypothetical protein
MHHKSEALKAHGIESRKKKIAFVQFFGHGGITIGSGGVALMC